MDQLSVASNSGFVTTATPGHTIALPVRAIPGCGEVYDPLLFPYSPISGWDSEGTFQMPETKSGNEDTNHIDSAAVELD
jgi:hypothetical protein